MDLIQYTKKDNIAYIILNNPVKRNALSLELMNKFQKQLDKIAEDKETKVLIIKGNGHSFCVGHDIDELVGKEHDLAYFKKIFSTCTQLMKTLREIPQIVVAQVHGAAFAAGCQLVAACDLAIAENKAKFCTPGVKIGLFCSTPMVPLSRVIGRRNALDMLFTGRVVSADEAKEFGLVNRVVDSDKLDEEVENFAKEIAKYSRYTLELGKKAFYKQIEQTEFSAYDYAKEIIAKNCLAYDAQEGMTAFLEKRKAEFKDK
jgi:enoyl-CoA hydratase/carnithine racemase